MPGAVQLTIGERFGRLTVVAFVANGGRRLRGRLWELVCDCGQTVITHVGNVRNGNKQSCGCLQVEQRIAVCKARITHGMGDTAVYRAFYSAKARCENPKTIMYPIYGGLGIEFRFTSFEQWQAELGSQPTPKHSVDRINPFGHYEPGNIRWATATEQAANTRGKRAIARIESLEQELAACKLQLVELSS